MTARCTLMLTGGALLLWLVAPPARIEEYRDVIRERLEVSPLDVRPVGLWASDGRGHVLFDGPWSATAAKDVCWCPWDESYYTGPCHDEADGAR